MPDKWTWRDIAAWFEAEGTINLYRRTEGTYRLNLDAVSQNIRRSEIPHGVHQFLGRQSFSPRITRAGYNLSTRLTKRDEQMRFLQRIFPLMQSADKRNKILEALRHLERVRPRGRPRRRTYTEFIPDLDFFGY